MTAHSLSGAIRRKLLLWLGISSLIVIVLAVCTAVVKHREALRMFFNPLPVPEELRVYRGKSELLGSVVHFSSSPAVIVAMIHSKELVEVPDTLDKPENSTSVSGYGVLRDTRTPWDWWQPATMAHPRFFFCDHHTGPGGQGWCEGGWINEATNEVYALIRD